MEKEIADAIESGEYTSASEIVREGLRLWRERRAKGALYEEWIAAQVELGWDQAERGEIEKHEMATIIEDALDE